MVYVSLVVLIFVKVVSQESLINVKIVFKVLFSVIKELVNAQKECLNLKEIARQKCLVV